MSLSNKLTAESIVSSLRGVSTTMKERFSGGGGDIDWLLFDWEALELG